MEKGKKGTKPLNRKSLKISSQNKEAKINPIRNSSRPSPRRPAAMVREHCGSGSGHAGGALKPAAESFDLEALDGQRSIISNGVNNSYRESESIYKKLVEASLQGIIIAQGIPPRLVYANPAISRILGYSSDELTSLTPKQIENLIHPDDRSTFFSRYKDRLEGKSVGPSYEIRATRKDGSTVWLELSATQIEYNGEPAVLATYVDITERKRVEETLRSSEEKYRTILENIGDGLFEVDLAGNFTLFNDSLRRMLGYSKDEMIGMNNRQYTDQENAKKLFQAFNRVFRTGEPTKEFDWEVIRKDGTKRYIEASVSSIRNPTGQPIGFRGIVRDITERKQAEEALKASEANYREIFDTANDAIFIHNTETGEILDVNRKMCEMYGYTLEEARRINVEVLSSCKPPYTQEDALRWIKKAVEGYPQLFEWRAKDKDGRLFWVEVNLKRATVGGKERLLAIVRDITERKKVEETFAQSEERYRTLVEESFDGIFIQKGFKIIFANRRLYEMLGYKEGELEGLDHWIVYHSDYQALTRERAKARMRGESVPSTYEVKFLRKDGSSFWGEIHAKVINFSGEPGIQVWARDISERKQAEETLRAERERFRPLSENAPFGMAMIDKNGTFKYINPKFKDLFGYDLNDVPDGKTWFRKAYPDPDYRHQVISIWSNDLVSSKSGEKRPRVFTAKCKDGSEKIINFISVQLEAGENLLACEDITDLKLAEETLKRSEEEAKQLAQENAVMAEIGRIISSSIDINEVYDQFSREVRKIIPFDRTIINIVNPEANTFITAYIAGTDVDGRSSGAVIRWDGSLTKEVFHLHSSLLVQTEDVDELAGRYPALLPHFKCGLRSFMAIPLISKGNVIGVFQLQSNKSSFYKERDWGLAERVGNQIAGAITNAKLFNIMDPKIWTV